MNINATETIEIKYCYVTNTITEQHLCLIGTVVLLTDFFYHIYVSNVCSLRNVRYG